MRLITDPVELVEALRSRCTMRLAELAPFRHGDRSHDLSYGSRWSFNSHLIHHLEELPDDVGSLAEMQELVDLTLESAQEDVDAGRARRTDSSSAVLGSAVASEAEMVRGWVEAPRVPVPGYPVIPYRRVLDHSRYTKTWRLLVAKFPVVKDDEPGSEGHWGTDLAPAAALLAKKKIERILFVHPKERTMSFEADLRLVTARPEDGAPHYFPPRGSFLTTADFDFYVLLPDRGAPRAGGWIAKKLKGA